MTTAELEEKYVSERVLSDTASDSIYRKPSWVQTSERYTDDVDGSLIIKWSAKVGGRVSVEQRCTYRHGRRVICPAFISGEMGLHWEDELDPAETRALGEALTSAAALANRADLEVLETFTGRPHPSLDEIRAMSVPL